MPKKSGHAVKEGNMYGKLLVLKRGSITARPYQKWVCRCACGNEGEYGYLTLNPSPSMLKKGVLPRTECNACRTSVCWVCGEVMPYRKSRTCCDRNECRDMDYERRTGTKLPDDPEERNRLREYRAYRRTISNRHNARRRGEGVRP